MADDDNTNDQNDEQPDGQNDDPNEPTVEELRAALQERDEEIQRLRKRRSGRHKPASERNDSEAEKRLKDLEDRETRLVQRLRASTARTAAADLNAIDAEAVAGLIRWDELEDPDDEEEVKDAIKDILKSRPHLRKTTRTEGGMGGDSEDRPMGMNDILRLAAGRAPIR
jgi:hypothetical protein